MSHTAKMKVKKALGWCIYSKSIQQAYWKSASSNTPINQTRLCQKQLRGHSWEDTFSPRALLVHITLLETSYSTCFRKSPFFSGISSTCTLSLLNSSCRVWESSSGFPWGACIRNCSGSLGSFTGGFAKSKRQKGRNSPVDPAKINWKKEP